MVAAGVVCLVGAGIWIWIDRRTADPIMKERINSGSDRYFAAEAEREKEVLRSAASVADEISPGL